MGRVSPFHRAISDIKDKYPGLMCSIVLDEKTFAPIIGFAYGDMRVSKQVARLDTMHEDYEYWMETLEELILPITREIKLNNIIDDESKGI